MSRSHQAGPTLQCLALEPLGKSAVQRPQLLHQHICSAPSAAAVLQLVVAHGGAFDEAHAVAAMQRFALHTSPAARAPVTSHPGFPLLLALMAQHAQRYTAAQRAAVLLAYASLALQPTPDVQQQLLAGQPLATASLSNAVGTPDLRGPGEPPAADLLLQDLAAAVKHEASAALQLVEGLHRLALQGQQCSNAAMQACVDCLLLTFKSNAQVGSLVSLYIPKLLSAWLLLHGCLI